MRSLEAAVAEAGEDSRLVRPGLTQGERMR